jgi:prepilin-type N-terminal cleavage/methylation domain-containing protein
VNGRATGRRGYTLMEAAVVLVVLALVAAVFVPVMLGSRTVADDLPGWASASAVLDTALDVYATSGPAPAAPGCDRADPAGRNAAAVADPCALQVPGVQVVGAHQGAGDPGRVSVAAHGPAPTLVVVTADGAGRCLTLVRDLPAGPDRYVTFRASQCTAAAAIGAGAADDPTAPGTRTRPVEL